MEDPAIAHHPETYRYSETEKHPLCEVTGAIIHGGILAWNGWGHQRCRNGRLSHRLASVVQNPSFEL